MDVPTAICPRRRPRGRSPARSSQDRLELEWPGAANDNADDDQPLDRISLAIVVLALTSFWLGLGALLAICWGAQ